MVDRPRVREAAHPTPLTYLKVGFTLAALTGIEVGVFYIDALEPVFLPIFILLSIAKFALVVMFYMHLKFDSRLFSGLFVGGLILAITVAVVLMALFHMLSATSYEDVDVSLEVPTSILGTAVLSIGTPVESGGVPEVYG